MFKKIGDIPLKGLKKGRFIEFFLMALSFWWSLILILPTSTFGTSTAYTSMALVATEPIWATYFLIVGLLHMIGLKNNNRELVMTASLISTITWLFVGTMLFIGSVATTGTGIYILVALLGASVYFSKGMSK